MCKNKLWLIHFGSESLRLAFQINLLSLQLIKKVEVKSQVPSTFGNSIRIVNCSILVVYKINNCYYVNFTLKFEFFDPENNEKGI